MLSSSPARLPIKVSNYHAIGMVSKPDMGWAWCVNDREFGLALFQLGRGSEVR